MANLAVVQKDFESEKEPWDKLELVSKEKPSGAKPGNVLLRIILRPINPADSLAIDVGFLQDRAPDSVVGLEGVGIVEAVGEGVTTVAVGERVVPILRNTYLGTWQQYVEVPASQAFPVPDDISDEVAAQFAINPLTAYAILGELQIPKGEYLLQTAAGSALGRLLIKLAKHTGVKTINVVRREEAKAELKALGADEVINSETEDVFARVKEITGGKRAYAAVDAVAGELTKVVGNSVRNGGQLLLFGMMSGYTVALDARDFMFGRSVRFSGFQLYDYIQTPEDVTKAVHEAFKLIQDKVFDLPVAQTFNLADYREAFIASRKVARVGKILLKG